MSDRVKYFNGIRLNRPQWFRDPAFIAWLKDPTSCTMSWHCPGEPISEWSDTMVFVDPSLNGEGSDSDMPEPIWNQILEACRQHFQPSSGLHIAVLITNVD